MRDFEQKTEVDGSRSLDFLSFSSFPLSSSSHLAAAPAAVHLREELGLAPGGGLSLVESIGAAAGGPGPEQGAEERRRRRRRKRRRRKRPTTTTTKPKPEPKPKTTKPSSAASSTPPARAASAASSCPRPRASPAPRPCPRLRDWGTTCPRTPSSSLGTACRPTQRRQGTFRGRCRASPWNRPW